MQASARSPKPASAMVTSKIRKAAARFFLPSRAPCRRASLYAIQQAAARAAIIRAFRLLRARARGRASCSFGPAPRLFAARAVAAMTSERPHRRRRRRRRRHFRCCCRCCAKQSGRSGLCRF